jgi:uncharacterized ion transporter superfamily protein YfcC
MDKKTGAQISAKAFLQSALILLFLIIGAGILTRVLPAGTIEGLKPGESLSAAFTPLPRPDYPIWRWFTAPIEVLWSDGNLIIITIIVFILLVSGAFAVLEKSGIINAGLNKIVQKFGTRKYLLLAIVSLFFMILGGFFGLLEEIIPLVPLMIALAYSLGWDALVGLGMSVLACNIGFSAAITNPFTIGVAQKLAGLPLFSGALYRLPVFLVFYGVLIWFLTGYARRIDKNPAASLVYDQNESEKKKNQPFDLEPTVTNPAIGRAALWFSAFLVLIFALLIASPFVPALSDYALPIVGVLFFGAGLAAGFISGTPGRTILRALKEGWLGIAPGIPLLLMAAAPKHIVSTGKVLDSILYRASAALDGSTPFLAVLVIFVLALIVEFFVASAGAKAVLMMPILLPLADLVGVTRQLAVTAYCFGDGFTNLAYPTNAILLISLGLASVSYGKWMKFSAKLWLLILPLVVFFLWLGTVIGFGPF